MLSTEEPVGPKNVTMHRAYKDVHNAAGMVRRIKWYLMDVPTHLDNYRQRLDMITLRLAHLGARMARDQHRDHYQQVLDMIERGES